MIFFHLLFLFARLFKQKLGSSLIYFFYLHTTIRQKYMIAFHLSLLCARPFDQKLRYSLVVFLYLYTTIRPKLGRSHSYSLIYYFLNYANISFSIFIAVLPLYFVRSVSGSTVFIFHPLQSQQCYSYISYKIFMEVLLLYFIPFIHGYLKSQPNNDHFAKFPGLFPGRQ